MSGERICLPIFIIYLTIHSNVFCFEIDISLFHLNRQPSHPLEERRPRQVFGNRATAVPDGEVQPPPDVHIDVVVLPECAHPVRAVTRQLLVHLEVAVDQAVDRHRERVVYREQRHYQVEVTTGIEKAWPVATA